MKINFLPLTALSSKILEFKVSINDLEKKMTKDLTIDSIFNQHCFCFVKQKERETFTKQSIHCFCLLDRVYEDKILN